MAEHDHPSEPERGTMDPAPEGPEPEPCPSTPMTRAQWEETASRMIDQALRSTGCILVPAKTEIETADPLTTITRHGFGVRCVRAPVG